MNRVPVRLFAGAADAFGSAETMIDDPGTLGRLIEKLAEGRDPRCGEILEQCSFFVGGEHCTCRTSQESTFCPPLPAAEAQPPIAFIPRSG